MRAIMKYTASILDKSLLVGMPYPVKRWQILTWAEHNGAGGIAVHALHEIPERTYSCSCEIATALQNIHKTGSTGPMLGCSGVHKHSISRNDRQPSLASSNHRW
jgi:hypothetical protein